MADSPSNQSKPTVDQKEQTVSGDQTNVAGNYYAAPAQPSHWPQYLFLFATIALLAMVAIVAVLVNAGNREPARLPIPSTPTGQVEEVVINPASPTNRPTWTPESTAQTDCLQQYSSEFHKEGVIVLEEGTRDFDIQLTQEDELVLQLTENKTAIGLIHLLPLFDSKSFKVEKILNEQCVEMTNQKARTLVNWEAMEFAIDERNYVIRLGYRGDRIRVTIFQHLQ